MLYSFSPDWFEYRFIYEKLVSCVSWVLTCVLRISTFWRGWFLGVFVFQKCVFHVSLSSRCSPRYLTSSSWGSCTLYMWTGGDVSLRVWNVTWTDLDPLAFIYYCKVPDGTSSFIVVHFVALQGSRQYITRYCCTFHGTTRFQIVH
jgi:hypothetical protein